MSGNIRLTSTLWIALWVFRIFGSPLTSSSSKRQDRTCPRAFSILTENSVLSAQGDIPSDGYEYIVVGSGAGGGPVASRLAMRGHRVLLLEAGDDQGENIHQKVPGYHPLSTEDPLMSWDFWIKHYSNPERAAQDSKMTWTTPEGKAFVGYNPPTGSKQRGIFYPRASTLGGCTAHNAMVHVYPTNSDWAHIANLTGDDSWQPENMRKIYERMEDCGYHPPQTAGHGFGGWLGVNLPNSSLSAADTKILRVGLEGGIAMGQIKPGSLPQRKEDLSNVLRADLNSANANRDFTEGIYQIPLDQAGGKRSGSRDIILSVSEAKNPDGSKKYPLYVSLNSLVTRVLFEDNTPKGAKPRAVGVEYLKGNRIYRASPESKTTSKAAPLRVKASKEVILSAGAFNTPQLLKLSGIGPKEELAQFKIPLTVDLPGVGTNLQDHFEIGVTSEAADPFAVSAACKFETAGNPDDPCFQQWKTDRSGPLASSNGFPFALLKKTSVAPTTEPDILVFGGATMFRGYFPGYSPLSYSHRNWTWVVLRAHTENRAGTVKLRSADALEPPEINFHFFDDGDTSKGEHTRDLQAMAEAIALARNVSGAVSPLVPSEKGQILKEVIPGPSVDTEEKVFQYIKNESWSHHASCTCPIGADNDPKAVLDSQFRVRGVDGLRVVDASVFPRIPGYFVVVPTYMIGEKAADVISPV